MSEKHSRKRFRNTDSQPSVCETRSVARKRADAAEIGQRIPKWLADLIESKTSITPVLERMDFDREHPIPHYLKGMPYWYMQGSSSADARRFFILPDEFMLHRFHYNAKTERMRYADSPTIAQLKLEQRDEKVRPPHQRLCWSKPYSHSLAVPGPGVNDIYLGDGPGPDTYCELFCSMTYTYGYKPDDLQIRRDHELIFCADLGTPHTS